MPVQPQPQPQPQAQFPVRGLPATQGLPPGQSQLSAQGPTPPWAAPWGQAAPPLPAPAPQPAAKRTLGSRLNDPHTRTWLFIGVPALVIVIVAALVIVVNNSDNRNVQSVHCAPQSLSSCLISAPSGSSPVPTGWGDTTTESTASYVNAYPNAAELAQPSDAATVAHEGLQQVVHREWSVGPDRIDLILLRFSSTLGAQGWAMDRSASFSAFDPGTPLSVTGDPGSTAYTSSGLDSSGNADVEYASSVGAIVLEAHYASSGSLKTQDFQTWAGAEYASLLTAPVPTPSPAPSATVFQNTTCAGNLAGCLMGRPSGDVPWPGPVHAATYSIDGYAGQLSYSPGQSEGAYENKMTDDGVTAIDTVDWTNSDDSAEAWLIVMQTRTDTGAQDLASFEAVPEGQLNKKHSVPGYPSATLLYATTPTSQGFYEGDVVAAVGTVYVEFWVIFTGSFNSSTADAWAKQELGLLTQNTSKQGIPIPVVTTPTLSAVTQVPCAGAKLSGCLMGAPQGTSISTSSSSDSNTDLSITQYANDHYSAPAYGTAWLEADQIQDIVHETWTGSGVAAEDTVLEFNTSREAQALVDDDVGDNMNGSQPCSVPALPHAYCLVLPQSAQDDEIGQVEIIVLGWVGRYEVDIDVGQLGSADATNALTWAQQQLAELPAS